MSNRMPTYHDALCEEDLVRALEELAEIVEIICAPMVPPPPPPRSSHRHR
jgi:hypothetical protein